MIHPSEVPVFILAGGYGTRLSEETQSRPKPMIEIGELPILIHIMRRYYRFGFNDFVICAGYRSWEIKQYFLNYEFRVNHIGIDHRLSSDSPAVVCGRNAAQERWRVRVVDTGLDCMTGGRLARAFDAVWGETPFSNFAVTYGDGLCDVDFFEELQFHASHGRVGTVLSVSVPSRFGTLRIEEEAEVRGFTEKPVDTREPVNGGFFFFAKSFREFLSSDAQCVLEQRPLEDLAKAKHLMAFRHAGFWYPMDTLRDKNYLEQLWRSDKAPWLRGKDEVPG